MMDDYFLLFIWSSSSGKNSNNEKNWLPMTFFVKKLFKNLNEKSMTHDSKTMFAI
jgi:hypothetical protein